MIIGKHGVRFRNKAVMIQQPLSRMYNYQKKIVWFFSLEKLRLSLIVNTVPFKLY